MAVQAMFIAFLIALIAVSIPVFIEFHMLNTKLLIAFHIVVKNDETAFQTVVIIF